MHNLIYSIIFISSLGILTQQLKLTQIKWVINYLSPNLKNIPLETQLSLQHSSCLLSDEEISRQAKAITVKIYSGNTSGSGIIIKKQKDTYTVVTNHHVTIFAEEQEYKLQTSDKTIYPAKKVGKFNFQTLDLDLLEFESEKDYALASLANSLDPNENSQVFAAGFPVTKDTNTEPEIIFNHGQIRMISPKPLQGGYQIGYTNEVKKGMSGGPLLNCQGQVMGINGRGTPLWGTPSFIFEDGTSANEIMTQKMTPLSWAIPIQTLLKFISE